MLGKLFSYELRALGKPAAVMAAIMVGAGLAGAACLGAAEAASHAGRLGADALGAMEALSSNAMAVLFMAALFCGFLVWASVAALYVFVAMRFYRTMFTDEGYLTLTLPVRTGTLVLAKFWAAYLLLVLFALGAMAMYALMTAVASGGEPDDVFGLFSLMGGWYAFAADSDFVAGALGMVNTLVTCAYAVGLAFGSLTLGAWWARRHKVAAAVGIYLAAGWALSLLFSIGGVLVMAGDTGWWEFGLAAVSVAQLVANLGVAAGAVALSAFVVRTKVDLS